MNSVYASLKNFVNRTWIPDPTPPSKKGRAGNSLIQDNGRKKDRPSIESLQTSRKLSGLGKTLRVSYLRIEIDWRCEKRKGGKASFSFFLQVVTFRAIQTFYCRPPGNILNHSAADS